MVKTCFSLTKIPQHARLLCGRGCLPLPPTGYLGYSGIFFLFKQRIIKNNLVARVRTCDLPPDFHTNDNEVMKKKTLEECWM